MNKQVAESVLRRANGRCEVCNVQTLPELHHIIHGSGKRTKHENERSVIALCYSCHRGTHGVHGMYGRKLDLMLKISLQKHYFNSGMEEHEVREKMGGRLYIDD